MQKPRGIVGGVQARGQGAGRALREHELVRLRGSFTSSGHEYREGTLGTVVGIWSQGELYEVEFTEPVPAVLTIPAMALAVASDVP